MGCITNGVTINGDKDDRLLNSVISVSDTDNIKLQIVAGYLNTPEFKQYIKDNTGIEEFLNVHANTFRKLLNSYYKIKNISVNNDISKKMSEFIGNFSSATALSIAKNHTADIIIDFYYSELSKPKLERKSNNDIIDNVVKKINNNFINNIALPLIKDVISNNKDKSVKELANKAKNIHNELEGIYNRYDELIDSLDSIVDQNVINSVNAELDSLDERINKLSIDRYIAFYNITQEAGNTIQKNYSTLVAKIRGDRNKWFTDVFTITKLINISNEFEQLLKTDKLNDPISLDDNDVINSNVHSIDEMSKSWENKDNKDFSQYISSDIKLYFSKLYKLTTPIYNGDTNYNYDTNNELGVPTTMSPNYIICQISNYGSFDSLQDFISSIEIASNSIPSLYGLGKLVNDMKKDIVFANNIYVQLSHPKINKILAVVSDNIDLNQSNKSIDPIGHMLVTLINQAKFTMKQSFDSNDSSYIQNFINKISIERSNDLFNNSPIRKQVDNYIDKFVNKYFPKLNRNDIINYLHNDDTKSKSIYLDLLQNLNNFTQSVSKIIVQQNTVTENYNKEYAKWKNSDKKLTKPVYNNSLINYKTINNSLIQISKKLIKFVPVKNELNSTNAEGNLSSDIVDNNYISNIIKQINYGNIEDQNAGLNRLKEFITQGHQYDYSTIYYGVKDSKGKTIVPGLFEKDSIGNVTINPLAKDIIRIALFNGAKDSNNTKSSLYSNMSKGDYFLTHLIAYYQPIDYIRQTTDKLDVAGFFLRTPSDAPKNYVIQLPKLSHDKLWNIDETSKNNYINKVVDIINNKYTIKDSGDYANLIDENVLSFKENNYIDANALYDIMTNSTIENRNYNNTFHIYDNKTKKVLIPLTYREENENIITIWLEGNKSFNTTNNIVEDLEIKSIISISGNKLPKLFINKISNNLIEEGINNREIIRTVNTENPIVRAAYANLYGELNNFVNNLNNVFEKNKQGKWVSKNNIDNLIDRYHYNGSSILDNNGRLSGNVFNFIKLFETNNYNVNEEINNRLFLYGGKDVDKSLYLFSNVTKNGITINNKRNDIIKTNNNKIELNINEENINILEDIVSNWVINYSNEIYNRTIQYKSIINDRFNNTQIEEAILNASIIEMSFDDLFEGNSKFYRNPQDFLKRSKEIQAGGNAYSNQNINDNLGSKLINILDNNNSEIPIAINDIQPVLPVREITSIQQQNMVARNGFRAVTIYNTIRPSDQANQIYEELFEINKNKIGEVNAKRIAKEIAYGYGLKKDNGEIDTTKVNDAQSYITIDEFIYRKFADGTLHEYENLIQSLIDNTPIEDINLSEINTRIQVQKNFYFDKQFDTVTKTYYPRQIKNAEFVLIPKLLPENSDLRKLYDIMKRNDIGQMNTAETSKAAKRNVLTYWDHEGNINPNFEKDINGVGENIEDSGYNDHPVENYYYRFLYKQQEVPEHMKDSKNKAGIQIMKKIIDNANTSNDSVRKNVNNIFDAYVANIKEDFVLLLNKMGWVYVNGQLQNKNGNNSTNLDFTEFYRQARTEAQRLGLDSNFIQYLTPNNLGIPDMPNYMNNVSSKLESIAQSIFNSAITRQTLPGWHAAQITNVGYDKKLKYHPKVVDSNGDTIQEAYAEVLLPRWSNLIPKDYDINRLNEEGLDLHIGYRIPTEGKQSISILKVVGFLDDTYGSTIMLPDEWVTQTGADFDVDSVYGICYETYKDKTGTIKKIQANTEISLIATKNRYIRYVNSILNKKVKKDIISDKFVKDKVTELYNELISIDKLNNSEAFNKLIGQESNLYKQLPKDLKNTIKKVHYDMGDSSFIERTEITSGIIEAYGTEVENEQDKQLYYTLSDVQDAIVDLLRNQENNYNDANIKFKSSKKELITSIYDQAKEDYFIKVERIAKDAEIESFEEFRTKSIIEQNDRRSRNNIILDNMLSIMKDPSSREENYSRSNFDDIIASMKRMNDLRGESKLKRSSYNPLDQIDFMENAMSGAQLKAFSVTRDTFNSVSNYVKATVENSQSIPIEYDLNKYTLDNLISAYGEDVVVNKTNNTAIVYHNRFAWSNTNRNIIGKLITTYSSQTTAHILDAIKEGAIFNENQYTFGTFKTLIDLGTDYDTAISFLMQPGITKIVDSYNSSKSIYINNINNPINDAIKNIAIDLNLIVNGNTINDYTNFTDILNEINSNKSLQSAFNELFGADISKANTVLKQVFILNNSSLEKRLNNAEIYNNAELSNIDKRYRDAAFDIAMVSTFNKIHNTTLNIEKLVRCSNPDRFGASQTIRATRNIINNILEYVSDSDINIIGHTLLVDNKPFLESLYPNIANGDIDISNSKYPYLAAFLKYSTKLSVETNSKLFATESKEYNAIINIVEERISKKFTDDQYREYKQYMISNVYNNVPYLLTPLTINEFGYIGINESAVIEQEENNTFYWNIERARLFGYDKTESNNFNVIDINNPTKEEVNIFNKLTPAQKVIWIQQNFIDGKGVFELLDVNGFNQQEYKDKGFSSSTIKYSDQVDNIEEIFLAFKESFFNKNPFVRLAAIDLIKYAFIVEGFKFKKGAISKIIPNDTMLNDIENKGLNLIDAIDQSFNSYTNPYESTTINFIERFIRSHSDLIKEIKIPKAFKNKQGNSIGAIFNRYLQTEDLIYIPNEESSKDIKNFLDIDNNNVNYIKLNRKNTETNKSIITLYKIKYANNGTYFIPLNLLERNEVTEYSINKNNNKYKAVDYYETIVNEAIRNSTSINELKKDTNLWEQINKNKEEYIIKPHVSSKLIESIDNINEIQRLSQQGTIYQKSEITKFITDVVDYVSSPVEELLDSILIRNDSTTLNNAIPKGISVVQSIPIGETTTLVEIKHIEPSNNFKWIIKGDQRGDVSKILPKERKAIENSIKAGSKFPTIYEVTQLTEEEQIKYNKSYAITSIVEDLDIDNVFNNNDSDNVAKAIIEEITYRSRKDNNEFADRFNKIINTKGINIDNYESIHDNKKSIYTSAAKYYEIKAQQLLNNINQFVASNGEIYSVDDIKLYNYIKADAKDYQKLTTLILDAKTFGNQFYDIFNLNIDGEDAETSKAISNIIKYLNSVRNNPKLAKAIELIFNNYIANNYSTNPLIRNGLIELRTQFGDTDWFDLQFSDIGELNNKQVQTTVKLVHSLINSAKLEANKYVEEFSNNYETIINRSGDFNWENVINKEGKLTRKYTEKFIEDKERLRENVYIAEDTYGTDSIEHIRAKLERDLWKEKNTQQHIVNSYYRDLNKLTKNIINNAPKEYSDYLNIVKELYGDNRAIALLTDEEKENRKQLKYKLKSLLSDIDENSNLKSEESIYRIAQLKSFIKAKKELNSEYFEIKEEDGWKTILNNYLDYIKNYENSNPYKTLDQRLLDDKYREAYDWIQANSFYKLDINAQNILDNAFKALSVRDDNKSKELKELIKEANAIDEYGNIDARKLSKQQILLIKMLTQSKYSKEYDSNAGEAILIKDIPIGLPVLKNSFYRELRGEGETAENPRRLQIIHEINNLITKGVDDAGRIRTTLLFEKLTEDEIKNLSKLYSELNHIKRNRKQDRHLNYKDTVEFKYNKSSFIEELSIARNNLTKSQYNTWLEIFVQKDKEGVYKTDKDGIFIPNNDIYGYIEPKDKTFIDIEKTNARNIVENSIKYIPTEYYYASMREAINNDTFNEWNELNHTFNPFTRKFEPLRIWTHMEIVPGGKLNGSFEYIPTNDNLERTVKEEYVNPSYKEYNVNYNVETGEYNNYINLSSKELDMIDYLQSIININASTHSMKKFAEQGFVPRRAKFVPDNTWYASQVIGSMGLEFRHTGENKWHEQLDYTKDFDADFDMMNLIRTKGYQKPIEITPKGAIDTEEEYAKRIEDIKLKNKEIKDANLALDNAIMDRDYKSVFQDFISKATIYNAKQKAKNSIYLLLEDLKENEAYALSRYSGNIKVNNRMSTTDKTIHQTVPQKNTYDITENWAKRILFNEFKKESKLSKWADLAQNITSAKYMVLNVTGGFANIFTGLSNVYGEVFAKDYFGQTDFQKAQARYFSNSLSMLSDMYNDKTNNLTVGISKLFNVVDFDAFTERRPNENATKYVKRIRDGLYSLQSGGEHYMQNTVLFAMLKSHRIFEDFDGTTRAGSLNNYIWKVEHNTLNELIINNDDLRLKYKVFIKEISSNLNELKKYDFFVKDPNEEFLRDVGDKNLIRDYIKARNKSIKHAKEEFNKYPTVESQFELRNGKADIKVDSKLTTTMFAELQQKVISVNKKIHGVYDREGAARIEREWWGGLVMQYHKHLYPGIMKRFRAKGYYNELRGSIERGSYVSLANFLSIEFKDIKSKIKNKSQVDNQNIAITSIQSIIKAATDTIINLKMNYELLPEWERNNMRRSLGDLLGVTGAFLVAIGIHLITDDDEIKDSELLSTVIYLADRCNSESSMYTPWGMMSESKTLWSSPIAATNGPEDLLKALSVGTNILFDNEYNPTYTTGLYKGENKLWVTLRRNIPIYRVYDRLSHMSKNNQYYRLNDNTINIKTAKNIADAINPD